MLEKQEQGIKKENFLKRFPWKWFIWIFLAVPILAYFHFGLDHLENFETADEFLWYSQGRIQKYWTAIGESDWKSTRINDKPGVTLALISGGISMQFEKEPAPDVMDGNRTLKQFPIEQIQEAHRNYRLPILIFNGIISVYLFWVVKKATGDQWKALFATSLILMQPLLIGISQIINPDALFWSFAIALLFTFLAFLESGGLVLAFLSMLFMGLTLASKYTGIIFFPFLILALLIHAFYHIGIWEENGEKVWKKMLWRSIVYATTVFGGIGIFAFLMPAAIVNVKYLAEGTYGFPGMESIFKASIAIAIFIFLDAIILKSRIIRFLYRFGKYPKFVAAKIIFLLTAVIFVIVLIDWKYELDLFGIFQMPFEGGKLSEIVSVPFYKQILSEARPAVFGSTPLVLIAAILTLIVSVIKKWKSEWLLFVLTIFIPVFFVAVIKQGLLIHVRYSIILFPILAVIAAVGVVELFDWGFLKKFPKIIIFALIIWVSYSSIESIEPFYFNYTNNFLPKKYSMVDGWGYGGYEAAQYLNSLPDAQNLKVVSDYTGVCQFFVGRCVRYTNLIRPHFSSRWKKMSYEYFVLSKKGFRRYGLIDEYPQFLEQKPLWSLDIDDRPENFIRVISSLDTYGHGTLEIKQEKTDDDSSEL